MTITRDDATDHGAIDDEAISEMFAALSHPVRLAIVARLAGGEANVSELARPFDLSLPAISRHIKVLERAGFVSQGRHAQYRPCTLDPRPLEAIALWTDRYRPIWEERFDRLTVYLDQIQQAPARERAASRPSRSNPTDDQPTHDQQGDTP